MPGRIFPDEPEEEYQARLQHMRDHLTNNGHDPAYADLLLEGADEIDADILRMLEAQNSACKQ